MVHFDIGEVPLGDVTVATQVAAGSLVLQRSGGLREADIAPGTRATVLFTTEGRLHHWSMRLEEVLPSSFFLTSLREPGEGERREFVRAHVPMRGRVRTSARAAWVEAEVIEDLSAAGFRVPHALAINASARVEVELWPEGAGVVPIRGVARVVRTGADTAFEFVELGSSEENRVSDLVFGAREAALLARLRSIPAPE